MQRRNEKGQFLPGNREGRKITADGGMASEMQRRATEARNHNSTIAAGLRRAMMMPDPDDPTRTMYERITGKAISKLANDPAMSEIRALADILGELTQKVDLSGDLEMTFKFGE